MIVFDLNTRNVQVEGSIFATRRRRSKTKNTDEEIFYASSLHFNRLLSMMTFIMMGPTHVLGGAAALALYATVSGQADTIPIWAFGVAGISALVPDADNGQGTILNRPHLLPVKIMTIPLWIGAPHRGRTHSFVGTIVYGLILIFWTLLFNELAKITQQKTLPLELIVTAGLIGYFSHLALDLFNITGELLLWPLPVRVFFPPWKPLRFEAGSWRELILVNLPLTILLGWYAVQHFHEIMAASTADHTIQNLLESLLNLFIVFLRALFGFITKLG